MIVREIDTVEDEWLRSGYFIINFGVQQISVEGEKKESMFSPTVQVNFWTTTNFSHNQIPW